jgi:hypothetical protein
MMNRNMEDMWMIRDFERSEVCQNPIRGISDLIPHIPAKHLDLLLKNIEFKAEDNFFLDLEDDARVCFRVSMFFENKSNAERIALFNKSKAQRRARYNDRIEANPELWERLMPMIQTPLKDLLPPKEWLAKCLEAQAPVEDMVALLQLYNEFAETAGEYPSRPDIVDQLAPWTTPGRHFDLERDMDILVASFRKARTQKSKRKILQEAQAKYVGRAGYPKYFLRPLEAQIHKLYAELDPSK